MNIIHHFLWKFLKNSPDNLNVTDDTLFINIVIDLFLESYNFHTPSILET